MNIVVQGTAGNVIRLATQTTQTIVVKAVGPAGRGIPKTGTQGQVLIKTGDADYLSEWHTLVKADIGLGNADDTSDADKPVSTAQAAAIAAVQADVDAHEADLANPHAVTKAQVGLGNVDNTSDSNKPVSTAQAAAIAVVQADIDGHEADLGNPHAVTKVQIGLGNADNTSDANKPISIAQQAALDLKAPLASPALTGTPTVPTAAPGTNTQQIANAAFVQAAIAALVASSPAALDTLNELATALGNDPNFATTMTNALALKAPIDSPTFTGTVAGITKAMVGLANVDNTSDANKPVSTAQQTALNLKANAANAALTGTATADRLDVGNILKLPEWTTAGRPANGRGRIGYNTDLQAYEGYSDAGWNSIGGGARGAPGNSVFYEADATVTGNYTITTGKNAVAPGPLTVNSGVTVTIPAGSVLTIV